jgi:5'(3')-deoxyribonucleotidase
MALLKKKVCWHGNVDYLAKWYPRSLPLIAERYRDFVQNRISAHIGIMNADDMKQLENWDLRPILSDSVHTDHADKLRIALLESQKAVKC